MTGKALMIQGTGSDVGKSIIVAGLMSRAAKNRGIRGRTVQTAKHVQQCSSMRTAVARLGALRHCQALASGVPAHTLITIRYLLKPETDRVAQVVVHGKVRTSRWKLQSSSTHEIHCYPQVLREF